MDQKELSLAIQQVCEEKGLTQTDVIETIEDALAAAFRKDFGDKKTQNIKTKFDIKSGDFEVFDTKEVVEDELKEKYEKIRDEVEKLKEQDVEITAKIMEEITAKYTDKEQKNKKTRKQKNTDKEKDEESKEDLEKKLEDAESEDEPKEVKDKKDKKDEKAPTQGRDDSSDDEPQAQGNSFEDELEKKFNPRTMISLSDAKEIKKSYKLEDEVITKLDVPAEFGRMAAQTAKQVIIQKIREAERDTIFNEFKDKVGELVVGTIQRQEGKVVLVDLGMASGIVLPVDQVKSENYKSNMRMKLYIKSVKQTNKGPEILLSRSHPEMLRKLFKLEVPEINSGAIVIKAIARDAGSRAKVAVMAKEEGLDPIGACIGQRGTRVQTIINELGGEKIDVIEWSEDVESFITNALAPAKVISIDLSEAEESKTVKALVKEDQYSLAIGKGGQNVRLAAQLVGMRIDIVMEGGEKGEDEKGEKSKEVPTQGRDDSSDDEPEEVKEKKDKKENKKDESKENKLDKPEKEKKKKKKSEK
ncbi:transcription termination factor NusA [Patescibacteria group bacterium]